MQELSRTSVLVAAARAFGSREPDPMVRNPDYLAEKLIRPEDLQLITDHPLQAAFSQPYGEAIQSFGVLGITWMILIRTRFIDAALQEAVARGATQVVILGAGFDSRAYRFREVLQACRVVEADARPTQEHKRMRVEAVAGPPPPNLKYVALNLATDDLPSRLEQAGLSRTANTFFVLEGVTMYLPEAVVRKLLNQMALFGASGSATVLDYVTADTLLAMKTARHARVDLMADWGEPWLFGVPEPAQEFFLSAGFDSAQLSALNDRELIRRFALQGDGTVYGAAVFQRMREQSAAQRPAVQPNPQTYWLARMSCGELSPSLSNPNMLR